jgi:hypothetical protein
MTAIKDILKLDLQDDIKNVIDLEDQAENEIQSEIESYIITDGLGHHLTKFVSQYTGNIKETGIWLSGFYGSGKSYFGKMLGYLIDNPKINGTSAQDRFLPRLSGVANQSLVENAIRKLNGIKSKVIFLDVAKQNTDNGLAFTLFAKLLKSLGFRDDLYGYMEYELFIEGKYDFLQDKAKELFGKEWSEIKKSNREIARAMRRVYKAMDYTEAEYEDTKNTYSAAIQNFSASKFKEVLEKYLEKYPEETLVFIFDEASEAISQKKFTLLDLEGLSEALSSIAKRVWTIAIAQEKLDDVINNQNVSRSQLTKVTDRFKTKIHLESTEVDVIIKNRLLLKKDDAYKNLIAFYKKNDGLISDATNLKSTFPTKTESAEEFATYYPFHRYQFDLLQKFLFSSNALVATQIAARGMIITTFDVLRKELKDRETFCFTTAYDLCTEAQPSPPADLVNKYSNAKKIVDHEGLKLNGEKLMKTIHFLSEAEMISVTLENITKSYITDSTSYYEYKPVIEQALKLLVETKILLVSNNNYQITSDLEGKLLEEMTELDIPLFVKKRELVNYLKTSGLFRQVNTINEDSIAYNFSIRTDLDDEIIAANNKNLRLTAFSLFNINEDRQDFIEGLKLDTQYTKDVITLVPDDTRFREIDRLLDEVQKYQEIGKVYSHDENDEKRRIVDRFATIKAEKEKDLINLIQEAYQNGSLIYLFDETFLSPDKFKNNINDVQKKLIKNVYTKRLSSQLSEAVGAKILNESRKEQLHKYFSGDEFKFFDVNGNFIGDNLKVIEEISAKLQNRYIEGKSLEENLTQAPWGYSYGTLSTSLAALFRAGRLVVKHNHTDYFSYQVKQAHEVFTTGAKFKNAGFKTITKMLSAGQKKQVVEALMNLDYEKHTDKKIDWSASDYDLADAVTNLAETFISSINTLRKSQDDFDNLFAEVAKQKDVLQRFSSKTTEANYIDKAEDFLTSNDEYRTAIKTVVKAEKFIKKNLDKIKGFERFIQLVKIELQKAAISSPEIEAATIEFEKAMGKDIIEHFPEIDTAAQKVRDGYYHLMVDGAHKMSELHQYLKNDIEEASRDLKQNYPAELNEKSRRELESLMKYAESRVVRNIQLHYHIQDQNSHLSLSEILNNIQLVLNKESELEVIKGNFIKTLPPPPDPDQPSIAKKINFSIPQRKMTAAAYRKILASQIQVMAGMDNDAEVEVIINNL